MFVRINKNWRHIYMTMSQWNVSWVRVTCPRQYTQSACTQSDNKRKMDYIHEDQVWSVDFGTFRNEEICVILHRVNAASHHREVNDFYDISTVMTNGSLQLQQNSKYRPQSRCDCWSGCYVLLSAYSLLCIHLKYNSLACVRTNLIRIVNESVIWIFSKKQKWLLPWPMLQPSTKFD